MPLANLKAIVTKGLGEGAQFMTMPEYAKQFALLLGFQPFAGTLNVKIDEKKFAEFLNGSKLLKAQGFEKNGRKFGAVKIWPVTINNMQRAALIQPEINRLPKNVAEIIAEENLRKKLQLKDGAELKLTMGEWLACWSC